MTDLPLWAQWGIFGFAALVVLICFVDVVMDNVKRFRKWHDNRRVRGD